MSAMMMMMDSYSSVRSSSRILAGGGGGSSSCGGGSSPRRQEDVDSAAATAASLMHQWLLRFNNQTHVVYLNNNHDYNNEIQEQGLLEEWSLQSGWPVSSLEVTSISMPFCSIRVRSSLRGGKGGFGTLLKGQSRQAGANMTTDFGACRDLQGRRLRHVNDEIKLLKWRQAAQSNNKQVVDPFDTPSGLLNWHLMTPNWASVSKKGIRSLKRQYRHFQKEQESQQQAKKQRQYQNDQLVANYIQRATDTSITIQTALQQAIQEGLQKTKAVATTTATMPPPPDVEPMVDNPNETIQDDFLCTLSGDVVFTSKNNTTPVQIQSQTDFATVVLMIPPQESYYYEVRLISGGLAQLGWASLTTRKDGMSAFQPNGDHGDGVGDDDVSYAYDGSRQCKFHKAQEESYGTTKWKAGDVVGCSFAGGKISYTLNGNDLGIAFTTPPTIPPLFIPAMSCNRGEILELRIQKEHMEYLPMEMMAVHNDLTRNQDTTDTKPPAVAPPTSVQETKVNDADVDADVTTTTTTTTSIPSNPEDTGNKTPKPEIIIQAVNLDDYESIAQLEKLGLDRLKGALMAIGVKCGGTLEERAKRLFSLKGLKPNEYPAKVLAKKKNGNMGWGFLRQNQT